MKLWGNNVGKVKEAIEQLKNQMPEIYESKEKKNLVSFMESKTRQLVEMLDKMPEKDFEKLKEEESLLGIYLSFFINCLIENGGPEAGTSLAGATAAMLIGKAETIDTADLLKTVGEHLFAERRFDMAYDVFLKALETSKTMLEIHKDSDNENLVAYWAMMHNDFVLWGVACEICLERRVSIKNTRPLSDLLESGEMTERTAAARALGALEAREAIPSLVKCLEDKENCVREEVLDALENIGDKNVVPIVKKCLSDKNESVRLRAVNVLKELGDATVIPLLENMRQKEEEYVQETVDEAIEKIKEKESENTTEK